MQATLREELKQFEKELSILLVRFMKICDQVEAARKSSAPEAPARAPTPPAQSRPKRPEPSLIAYA